jgi:monofunctional biosynthetic peptidoglycan transglycosylase
LQTRFYGTPVHHQWTSIDAVAPAMWETVIAAEDQNFCAHEGFDRKAIDEARRHNARGGRLRGASTISQQTAKNVFLWPARTYVRKGFEAYFTVLEEFLWPKRRIMEIYLNVAEFGTGVFGVEAASQQFFHKPARNLSRYEAALLVAVLPNPKVRHAEKPRPYVAQRASLLVNRAYGVRADGLASCMVK